MPLYDYQCETCGPFSAMKKMTESGLATACGNCGSMSERVISVPYFALLTKAKRSAYERNEKSAHEPKAVRRSSCGCSGAHTCNPKSSQTNVAKENKTQSNQQAGGFQMQTKLTARPWMLGH
jgi:putative FmdB family regulatory protein